MIRVSNRRVVIFYMCPLSVSVAKFPSLDIDIAKLFDKLSGEQIPNPTFVRQRNYCKIALFHRLYCPSISLQVLELTASLPQLNCLVCKFKFELIEFIRRLQKYNCIIVFPTCDSRITTTIQKDRNLSHYSLSGKYVSSCSIASKKLICKKLWIMGRYIYFSQ